MPTVPVEAHKQLTYLGNGKFRGVRSFLCLTADMPNAELSLTSQAFPGTFATSASVPSISVPYVKNTYGDYNPGARPGVVLITAYYESDGIGADAGGPSGSRKVNYAKISGDITAEYKPIISYTHTTATTILQGWSPDSTNAANLASSYWQITAGPANQITPHCVFRVETAADAASFNANTIFANVGKINASALAAPLGNGSETVMLLGGRFWYEVSDNLVYIDYHCGWEPAGWNNLVTSTKFKSFITQGTAIITSPVAPHGTYFASEPYMVLQPVDSSNNPVTNLKNAVQVVAPIYGTANFTEFEGKTWWTS